MSVCTSNILGISKILPLFHPQLSTRHHLQPREIFHIYMKVQDIRWDLKCIALDSFPGLPRVKIVRFVDNLDYLDVVGFRVFHEKRALSARCALSSLVLYSLHTSIRSGFVSSGTPAPPPITYPRALCSLPPSRTYPITSEGTPQQAHEGAEGAEQETGCRRTCVSRMPEMSPRIVTSMSP